MNHHHCTKCGKIYAWWWVPSGKVKAGKNKGKTKPMCCDKTLRKISGTVYRELKR